MGKERLAVSALQLGQMTVTEVIWEIGPTVGSSPSVTTKKGHFFVRGLELSEGEGSEVKAGCWPGNQTVWQMLAPLPGCPSKSTGSLQCLSA